MAALGVRVGDGTDMLLSLSSDKSTLPSLMARRPSVECYSAEDDGIDLTLTQQTKPNCLDLNSFFLDLSPFGDNEVRQELMKLLSLYMHRRYFHVSLEHLAADGLTVHCI